MSLATCVFSLHSVAFYFGTINKMALIAEMIKDESYTPPTDKRNSKSSEEIQATVGIYFTIYLQQ